MTKPDYVLACVLLAAGPASAQFFSAETICNRGDIYICDDFDTVLKQEGQQGWIEWTDLSKQLNPDTTISFTGLLGKSVRADYDATSGPAPDGGTGAIASGSIRHYVTPAGTGGEWYARFYWRHSPTFWEVPGGGGSKLFYFNSFQGATPTSRGNNNHRLRWYTYNPTDHNRGVGPWDNLSAAQIGVDVDDDENEQETNQPNPITMATDSTWYCIELYAKVSSGNGATDGAVKWWINGQLQGQNLAMNTRGTNGGAGTVDQSQPFNYISIDAYFGGGNHNLQPAQSVYYDNVVVSANRIGCLGSADTKSPAKPRGLRLQ